MREPEGYRDTIAILIEQDVPILMNKTKASEVLGISRHKLYDLIANKRIVADGNNISVFSIAHYLCTMKRR